MSVEVMGAISVVGFVLAAFFAGSETAVIASDRVRMRHHARKGDRRARLVLNYINQPEYFLSIVLVGTNLGVIGCTSMFTAILIRYFGDSGATIATAILVPTLLIFEEIIPKGVFLYYADRASMLSIYPLKFFAVVLYPIIKSFSELTNFITRLFGIEKMDRKVRMTMEELLFHLRDSRDAGLISRDTMSMASRAFQLLDFSAKDIMLPLSKVVMVEAGRDAEYYRDVFLRERFSRMPVYAGSRQQIAGFVSIRDVFKAARHPDKPLPPIEDAYIVNEETPIVEMLARMKSQGCHMAMIRRSDGEVVGMTTLEDILERLVGAITDEFH